LPVRRLWGIGPVAEEKLNRLGIERIGQLAALTDAEVANILGATVGPALHRLARGIDDRPVAERAEAKQISSESTFAVDLTSLEQLRDAIDPIAEHAHQRLLRDGRGARTVTVKLKKSDMSTLTRSATLPYATTEAGALIAVARRLLLDPREIGPIRLLGVGFSGLSDVRQQSLFPDLELAGETSEEHPVETATEAMFAAAPEASPWRIGDDVAHSDFGHGWVQGAGHGVVTVRFETRSSGPGQARTFPADTGDLVGANPIDSLDWPDYVGALQANALLAPAVDDVRDG
jgi:DNA polymerase-4